jgi:hypothetical protein
MRIKVSKLSFKTLWSADIVGIHAKNYLAARQFNTIIAREGLTPIGPGMDLTSSILFRLSSDNLKSTIRAAIIQEQHFEI